MNIQGFFRGCEPPNDSREEVAYDDTRIDDILKSALNLDRDTAFSWDNRSERATVTKKGAVTTSTLQYDLKNDTVSKSTAIFGIARPEEVGNEERVKLKELKLLVTNFNTEMNKNIAKEIKAKQEGEKNKPLTLARNERLSDFCKKRLREIGSDHPFFNRLKKKEFKVQANEFIDVLLKIEDYHLLPEYLNKLNKSILGESFAADDLLPLYEAFLLVSPERVVSVTDRLEIFDRQMDQGNQRDGVADYLLTTLSMAHCLVTNELRDRQG